MTTATATPAEQPTAFRRALILATVTMATTLYATTILVVSVILPQMQGSLSATQDQIAWAMTFNILATAIVTPMTGWLTGRFGRRNVLMYSLLGFTIATFFCGASNSLEMLVAFRILQGAFGAPMVPLAQATILDTYPKEQHGMATSVFGMAVVVGPVIGPIVGGHLADLYNWRWAFFMIVPAGFLGLIGLWFFMTDGGRQQESRFDWTGFLALSVAVACTQLMLDRGQRLDWFESIEIVIECVMAIIAFYIFLAHSLTTSRPFLNLKHLLDRNYALGLMTVMIYGMLNFTPMILFPPMLQNLMGYPNTVIGELLGARGAGAIAGFFLAIYVGKLDPRIGMLIGMGLQIISGFLMMTFDLNVSFYEVAAASALQGLAVGLFWVPLTVASFSTISPQYLAETSATFHLLRNLGSSIFISLSVAMVIRTAGQNYSRLSEHITPYNENMGTAFWNLESVRSLAAISGEVSKQAAMIGYLNSFALFTLACAASVPLILMFKIQKR